MKNNFFFSYLSTFLFILVFTNIVQAQDDFSFDVTEIEILNKGNLYKGLKRGIINTNEGIVIEANKFIYNKITNIVDAEGKVKVEDIINNYTIFSDTAKYDKNKEIIITEGNSKGVDNKNRTITSDKLTYNKITNIVDAEGEVKVEDEIENYTIKSEKLTYFREVNKIISEGFTEANFENNYKIETKDATYLLNTKELSSKLKSTIIDNDDKIYYLDEFTYYVDASLLKGKNVLTITNYGLPKSDKFFFLDGIFNLKEKSFTASDTKINIHKSIFDRDKNDPRIYGASSKSENNITIINKGIFTTCQKREGCPPWSIKSEKIEHDRNKKQIKYKNAFLNVYDIPVFYFPKFFHPDPTVNKQSGFLRPEINKSNVLGSSLTQPYFKVISDNQDYTISPTWFDKDIISLQNEYRQANKSSNFLADFGFVKGYKSSTSSDRNTLSHIFVKYVKDLNFDDFNLSKLELKTEQVSNDTYLKVFNNQLTKSNARPSNLGELNTNIKLFLNHEKYNFETGFLAYENLGSLKNSDKYEYVLPYFNFDTVLDKNYFNGSISLNSSGSNNLSNTNNLKSNIINNLNYTMNKNISNFGFENEANIAFKNLNSIGKNNSEYKSSPQVELVTLFEANSSLPLIKKNKYFNNYITPKISFRFNPSDMKNYNTSSKKIDVGNAFSLNRLGLSDTFESGRSLTLGVDFKREKNDLNDINKYFEIKLATVIRDKEEKSIPKTSTINKKQSNVFGSVENNLSENINLNYNFSLDNDLSSFEYNEFSTRITYKNLITDFNFIEENGEIGDSNIFENSISYTFDENNFIKFKTRRNRKINLTEYYDLVYEYKNDCLTAGIKYKKSYYEDRDLKPNEDLFFTITLFPLTTYEYDANDLIEN